MGRSTRGAVQGRWERVREQKERERAVGKAAGDECVFIPGEGPSCQMKSSDTIPEAAGGEGGHGSLDVIPGLPKAFQFLQLRGGFFLCQVSDCALSGWFTRTLKSLPEPFFSMK